MLDYVCRLLQKFPGLTRTEVWWELPMDQGWPMYYWALENDAWLQFNGIRRAGNGYVGQEIERLVNMAFEEWGLKKNGKANSGNSVATGKHCRVPTADDGGT